MSITLGSITFDDTHTSVAEAYAEVGGQDARKITISGLIADEQTVSAIEARLDDILDAASAEDYSAALSVRDGRQLRVRRESFKREVRGDERVGSFTLVLDARDPFETAVDPTSTNWNVTASGDTLNVSSDGNAYALPTITVLALDTLINPTFSDGNQTISYAGTVAVGQTLVFDAASGAVTLDGADVTPYSTGLFPQIPPEGVTLEYTDDVASTHSATVTVAYHDRWW